MNPFNLTVRVVLSFTLLCLSFSIVTPTFAQSLTDTHTHAALHPSNHSSTSQVQVFDIKQEKIILQVENNKKFQRYAGKILKKLDTLAPQLKIPTDCTHIIKLPLEEAAQIKLKDQVITANELFIFYSKNGQPLILVFNDQRKPFLFQSDVDIAKLMQLIEKAAA